LSFKQFSPVEEGKTVCIYILREMVSKVSGDSRGTFAFVSRVNTPTTPEPKYALLQ
jgi:hypothetical protein